MDALIEAKRSDTNAAAPSAGPRRRLAIVSTYDELCGIAAFTRSLVRNLESSFDVTVFDLDQFLMHNRNPNVRRRADQYFLDICAKLKEFDLVNVQLEFGTLGVLVDDIIKRMRWLIDAHPHVSLTMHTVPRREAFNWTSFSQTLRRVGIFAAMERVERHWTARSLHDRVYKEIRRAQKKKDVKVLLHTRRDRRYLQYVVDVENVHDHPLAFFTEADAARIQQTAGASAFPTLANLPADAKLIGVFGFLSEYKNFETAIRAMRFLPPDYHLLIFGAVHPNDIRPGVAMTYYVKQLLREIATRRTMFDRLSSRGESFLDEDESEGKSRARRSDVGFSVHSNEGVADLLADDPNGLGGRVHFMGALSDEMFAVGMATCDAVVLPYLEVGQSSSGPLSQAVELGCNIFASRNHAFLQFAKYHPDRIRFFDVGNYVELAEQLRTVNRTRPRFAPPTHTARSLHDLYSRVLNNKPTSSQVVTHSLAK